MTAWLVLAFCCSGLAALSAAMDRHDTHVLGRAASPALRWLLRGTGTALLLLGLALCLCHWNISVGILAWLGLLTPAAILVAMLLSYSGRHMPRIAVVLGLATLAALARLLAAPV